MTTIDIDAIRQREQAATPGPWGVGNDTNIVRGLEVTGPGSYTCIQSVAEVGDDRCDWDRDEAVEIDPWDDAQFIAHARQDIPALLAKVAELTAERDAALAAVRDALAELEDRTAEARGAREDYEQLRGINAELAAARDAARPVVEAAKAWRDWYAASPVRMQSPSDAEEALIAAVDALPKTEVAS